MVKIVFDSIKHTARKTVKCTVCGKPVQRQKTFYQTVNPFNKNSAGEVKTASEIFNELVHRGKEWSVQPDSHQKCLTVISSE